MSAPLMVFLRVAALLLAISSPSPAPPPSEPVTAAPQREQGKNFNIVVIPTRQNPDLDWWYFVPEESRPLISRVGNLVRGESFSPLVIFSGYGIGPEGEVDLVYDLEIFRPDGGRGQTFRNLIGYQGPLVDTGLLPGRNLVDWSAASDDPLGAYKFQVIARDLISGVEIKGAAEVTLSEFSLPRSI